jgi:hypothetical protein
VPRRYLELDMNIREKFDEAALPTRVSYMERCYPEISTTGAIRASR